MPKKHACPEDRLTKHIQLRLTEPDFDRLQNKISESGLTQSEFMREAVLANRTTIAAKPRKSAFRKEILFLFGKTSNNMNQLAHRANVAHVSAKVNSHLYVDVLTELRHIRALLGVTLRID